MYVLPWHMKNLMFVNYSITKYIKFQSINNQKTHTFDQCQIKLGITETVLKLSCILSKNLESFNGNFCWSLYLMYFVME